jgi:hypothetical protein
LIIQTVYENNDLEFEDLSDAFDRREAEIAETNAQHDLDVADITAEHVAA